jgi:hypothetical protein
VNVASRGFWLLLDGREVFVGFDRFPWFREATIGALLHVELPHAGHLRWPELDLDLEVDSIDHPDRYPLVSRVPAPAVSEKKRPRSRERNGA